MTLNLALPSLKGGEVPVARADPVNPPFQISKYHADVETISFKGIVLIKKAAHLPRPLTTQVMALSEPSWAAMPPPSTS